MMASYTHEFDGRAPKNSTDGRTLAVRIKYDKPEQFDLVKLEFEKQVEALRRRYDPLPFDESKIKLL